MIALDRTIRAIHKSRSPAAFRRTAALRQKLPLASSKFNFRFTPETGLNSAIAACPKSANGRRSGLGDKAARLRRPCLLLLSAKAEQH
jgi:hypothetical protein